MTGPSVSCCVPRAATRIRKTDVCAMRAGSEPGLSGIGSIREESIRMDRGAPVEGF